MTTDEELLAELKATPLDDDSFIGIHRIGCAARAAIPRMIAMVEERERERHSKPPVPSVSGVKPMVKQTDAEFIAMWKTFCHRPPPETTFANFMARAFNAIPLLIKMVEEREHERDAVNIEHDKTAIIIIGDFMLVPPDGGDLKLHEGARRMRDALEKAEVERDAALRAAARVRSETNG